MILQWICPQSGALKTTTQLISLQIKQQEGFLPLAKILLPSGYAQALEGAICSLMTTQHEILMKDCMLTHMTIDASGCERIKLVPQAMDEPTRQRLNAQMAALAPHHDLFSVRPFVSQAYPALIEYNRQKGAFEVSDLSTAMEHTGIAVIQAQDIEMIQVKKPYEKVQMTLDVQWIQPQFHLMDVGSALGEIETLTGEQLQDAWPQTGQSLANGSMAVLQSALRIKDQILIPLKDTPEAFLMKTTLVPELLCGASFQVKRTEKVTFNVHNRLNQKVATEGAFQMKVTLRPTQRHFSTWQAGGDYVKGDRVCWQGALYEAKADHVLNCPPGTGWVLLQNNENPGFDTIQDSFFLSHQGQKTLSHALSLAKARLIANGRCMRIKVPLSFSQGKTLTTTRWLEIHHPRLPGGSVRGKIVDYEMQASFGHQSCWAIVAVGMCTYKCGQTHGVIPLREVDPVTPSEHNFIEDIALTHDAQDQWAAIEELKDQSAEKIPLTAVAITLNAAHLRRTSVVHAYEAQWPHASSNLT